MMKLHIFLSILFIILFTGFSGGLCETPVESYMIANKLYAGGSYQEALEIYRGLEKKGIESSDLFYNVGNAYFRISNIGSAIQYYRKALKLNPWDGDIKNNLSFAEEKVIDKIEISTERKVKTVIFFWYYFFGLRNLVLITAVIAVFMWIVLIVRLYRRTELLNQGFYLLFSLFVIFSISSFVKYYEYNVLREGVVTISEVPVRSSANERGVVLYNLHDGTLLRIRDELGGYYRIELKDEKSGWIRKDCIGVI